MRWKRAQPLAGDSEQVWTTAVMPWTFYLRQRPWGVLRFAWRRGSGGWFACASKRDAEAGVSREWLRHRLNAIHLVVKEAGLVGQFQPLYNAAWHWHPSAEHVLRDWLCEYGFEKQLTDWIIRPGTKAGVVWPGDWATVAQQQAALLEAS